MKMAQRIFLAVTALLLVQLTGGKDLYWVHNTNWNEPSNWALGRVPCGGDTAKLPNKAVTFLNDDVTVGSIVLPENGVLVLKPSVTIRFADNSECDVPTDTKPMAADVKENQFISPPPWWECPENWKTKDNLPTDHPPCGEDNAVFEMGSTFSVTANESITVRSITVRGNLITSSKDQLDKKEFNLNITIEPNCGENPSLCPCPSDAGCPKKFIPTITPKAQSKRNTAGIVVGVIVVAVVVTLILVVIIIVGVVLYRHYQRSSSYTKEELLEDQMGDGTENLTCEGRRNPKRSSKEPTAKSDVATFENPVYDLKTDEVEMIGYETKLSQDDDDQSFKPSLSDYELTGEMLKPSLDVATDPENVAASDEGQDKGKVPTLYEYEKL